MRSVIWSSDALDEFDRAIGYIAEDNPYAADRVADAIAIAVEGLTVVATGRKGRVDGTYEKVVAKLPYIIAYALHTEADGHEIVYLLHVIHTSRNWKPGSWPEQKQ